MKLVIERAALLAAIERPCAAVPSRNTIPIVGCVLIEAADGRLAARGTDMDMTVTSAAAAVEMTRGGAVAVQAGRFADVVASLPEGCQVALSGGDVGEGGSRLTLTAGRARFAFPCLDPADFPAAPSRDLPHSFTLTGAQLQHLLGRTRHAMEANNGSRDYLKGVSLDIGTDHDGPTLNAAATDGHRLAHAQVMAPEGSALMPGVILPRQAVNAILKLVDGAGEVEIGVSDNLMRFATGDLALTTRLLDGTYPDWRRTVPRCDNPIEVQRLTLRDTVRRVSRVLTERSSGIRFAAHEGALKLSCVTAEAGDADETIDARVKGAIETGFNARYLLDAIDQTDGDVLMIETTLGNAGAAVRISSPEVPGLLHIVMPMRA